MSITKDITSSIASDITSLIASDPAGFGPELYPQDNAASVDTEVNASTGWTANGTATLGVASGAGQFDTGSYALSFQSNGPNDQIYFDLNTILTNGTSYQLTSRFRHTGVGAPASVVLAPDTTGIGVFTTILKLTNTPTTFQDANHLFVHDSTNWRYLAVREDAIITTGGGYYDTISIREVL